MTDETRPPLTLNLQGLRELTLDLGTITLGEMDAIERASGQEFGRLLARSMGRRLVALYLREWRSSGREPSWAELSNLRPLGSGSSVSASSSAGPRPTSND